MTGKGVGIAVLDSGIYFEPNINTAFSQHTQQQFFGQVDFVGDGLCPARNGMDQYDGYCFSNKDNSYDGYGHGSHIAGLIWNNITDQDTGVMLGIAPDAEHLSACGCWAPTVPAPTPTSSKASSTWWTTNTATTCGS